MLLANEGNLYEGGQVVTALVCYNKANHDSFNLPDDSSLSLTPTRRVHLPEKYVVYFGNN